MNVGKEERWIMGHIQGGIRIHIRVITRCRVVLVFFNDVYIYMSEYYAYNNIITIIQNFYFVIFFYVLFVCRIHFFETTFPINPFGAQEALTDNRDGYEWVEVKKIQIIE